jgi:putative cardiolipin synthase
MERTVIAFEFAYGPRMRALGLVIALLLVQACAPTLSADLPIARSTAPSAGEDTALGREFAPDVRSHPGESGFRLLDEGQDAFQARLALADLAQRSLDAQYFLWSDDAVGMVMIERLVRAASRGVRVRLLVDDIHLSGGGTVIAALDAHPSIEIKIYNPIGARNPLRLGRRIDLLLEFGRLNHRMHNKLFVADNQIAVMGGRNMADEYFGIDPTLNFRDMDVIAAGPIVQQLSSGFDTYWNSRWAVPMSMLKATPSSMDVNRIYTRVADLAAWYASRLPFPIDAPTAVLAERAARLRERLIWARAEAVWADPAAGPANERPGEASEVARTLALVTETTRTELITQSPYHLPTPDLGGIRRLRARGVRLRMLTNSLASTDVPPAYAMYAKHRRRMLAEGVEMYEVRPDAESRRVYTRGVDGARLSLHAKVAVIDREIVYIGSFNLDPRSTFLNTEVALLVYSSSLAEQMLQLLERDFRPENAWQLALGTRPDGRPGVVWVTRESGHEVRSHRAPETGFWRRLGARVYGLLPIRGQL